MFIAAKIGGFVDVQMCECVDMRIIKITVFVYTSAHHPQSAHSHIHNHFHVTSPRHLRINIKGRAKALLTSK